jgi:tetratricopeptide (TPR) repeat protein
LHASPAPGQPADTPENAQERLTLQDGLVQKLRGEELVWQTELAPQRAPDSAFPGFLGPVRLGDRVLVCAPTALYHLSELDGRVLRRQNLPGPCLELAPAGQGARVVAAAGRDELAWRWEQTLTSPEDSLPLFLFPTSPPDRAGGMGLWARQQARLVSELPDGPAERTSALAAKPELRQALEAAATRLVELMDRDPTNPWYAFQRGEYLGLLGRADEARQAYRQALGVSQGHEVELVPLAGHLERIEPALAEEAYTRGLRHLVSRGFEPELCHSLLAVAVLLGKPQGPTPLEGQALLARARRLWGLAPLAEGAQHFYLAAAEAATGPEAERFRLLAAEAQPYRVLGPAPEGAGRTGLWLQALLACMLGILGAGLAKTLRTLSMRYKPPIGSLIRWNPLSRWTRGELLGLLAVLGLGLWVGQRAAHGVLLIGAQAQSPLALLMGQLHHPEASAFLDRLPDRPGVRLLGGLARLQAGQPAAAGELLAGVDAPEARLNLGVAAYRQGDRERARELWEQVRAEAPHLEEARFNLELLDQPAAPQAAWPATGSARRVQRARALGLQGPLLAIPTLAQWNDVWLASAAARHAGALDDPLSASLIAVSATDPEGRAVASFWETLLWVSLGLAALALLALLTSFGRRELAAPRRGKLGWFLGVLLPGAARQYWLLGVPLTAAFAFQAFGAWVLAMSDGRGVDLLANLAEPSAVGVLGAQLSPGSAGPSWLTWTCQHWWVTLAANLVFVIVAERVAADPAGPFIRIRGMQRATWKRS